MPKVTSIKDRLEREWGLFEDPYTKYPYKYFSKFLVIEFKGYSFLLDKSMSMIFTVHNHTYTKDEELITEYSIFYEQKGSIFMGNRDEIISFILERFPRPSTIYKYVTTPREGEMTGKSNSIPVDTLTIPANATNNEVLTTVLGALDWTVSKFRDTRKLREEIDNIKKSLVILEEEMKLVNTIEALDILSEKEEVINGKRI